MCIRHSLVRLTDVDAVINAPASFHSIYDDPAILDGVDVHNITFILVDGWCWVFAINIRN